MLFGLKAQWRKRYVLIFYNHLLTIAKKKDQTDAQSFFLAGVEGFEPPNAGTRTQCLTTWRHPIGSKDCTTFGVSAQVLAPD